MNDVLLEIRGLKVLGDGDGQPVENVRGVDLTLRRGEVLGVIGESGAGKSTLGLAAMGFARAGCRIVAGSVRFDGQDLAELPERIKRRLWGVRIAYVPQSAAAAFNPAQRLERQVAEVGVRHRVMQAADAARRGKDLFRRLHLPQPDSIGRRFPHQVSGGQLQRVMTAMAMSCGPDLIVFDEPTTALDVTTQIEVLAAIKELVRQSGTAAIYITHDLAVVAQMADRIMVLRHGKLVEEAPTRGMLASPRETYTKSLWAVRSLNKAEAPGGEPLLEVEDLEVGYRNGPPVLHGVSLAVPRGRTVAVVGESGSGKSTLARTIAGLLSPRRGEIRFGGSALPARLESRDTGLLRRVQMIYQMPDTALNPRRRIRSMLSRPLRRHLKLRGAANERRVRELMDMVELPAVLLDRFPGELAGGQKQRVGIARALAVEPELILCDEVTSALDQLVAEGVLKLLLRLQQELKVSYLYITHDLATVKAIAAWIVVMHQGRIVQQGLKSEVLAPPHHPYTELLLSSVPEMRAGWLDELLERRQAS